MNEQEQERVRNAVRTHYSAIAAGGSCCGAGEKPTATVQACGPEALCGAGYDPAELRDLPPGAHMWLGCGNPVALATLEPGQTVVDLGSGGGVDCFLAARKVGPEGKVIGVDMTAEMVAKAREAARAWPDEGAHGSVEFRLGEIEHLPVADATADVVISNCVINLSTQKQQVFDEAFRVLRPGGHLSVSDIVALEPIPDDIAKDPALHASCVAGAETVAEIETMLARAGFVDIRIEIAATGESPLSGGQSCGCGAPGLRIASASIRAAKPE